MYVRIIKFVLGPDRQWEAERMADVLAALTRSFDGCRGFYFFGDHRTGEYQTTSFWESGEAWDMSFKEMWPVYCSMVGDDFQWQPTVERFEVYEPKPIPLNPR